MKKKKKRKFYQIFNILLLIVSIIFLGIIYVTNVLNIGYFIGICFLILLITFLLIGRINKKHLGALFLGFIFFILEIVGCIYLGKTNSFLDKIHTKTEVETYRVIVLNSYTSSLEKLEKIGVLKSNDDGYTKAVETIKEKISKIIFLYFLFLTMKYNIISIGIKPNKKVKLLNNILYLHIKSF